MEKEFKISLCDLNYNCLNYFTRADLRNLAHKLNIFIGKDKADTIYNLIDCTSSVKLTIKIEV